MSRDTMELREHVAFDFVKEEFSEMDFNIFFDISSVSTMVPANEWSYDKAEPDWVRYGWRQNKFLDDCLREIEEAQITLFQAERSMTQGN